MKIRTLSDLEVKCVDGRKLTLRLEWHHLTAQEVQKVEAQIRQTLDVILDGQEMLFVDYVDRTPFDDGMRCRKSILWKQEKQSCMRVMGFVRTQESFRTQKRRVKQSLRTMGAKCTAHRRSFITDWAGAVDTVKEAFGTGDKSHSLYGLTDEEFLFCYRKVQQKDGTYDMDSSISINGFAIAFALQKLTEQYKEQLWVMRKETPLFAGYIFYETVPMGAYAHYHAYMGWAGRRGTDTYGLSGYEWAAFINKNLVNQLTEEKLAQLQQFADVTFDEDGLFYETRCEIVEYGFEEKKRCRDLFYDILQPAYGYAGFPVVCWEKVQGVMEKAYFVGWKDMAENGKGMPGFIGFFSKITPEEVLKQYHCDFVEEIQIL